jgi:hypothetical protein
MYEWLGDPEEGGAGAGVTAGPARSTLSAVFMTLRTV